MDFNNKLRKYAELLVKVGLNVKKDMYVVIRSPIEAKEIVELCIDESYKAGACEVHVIWSSPFAQKQKLKNASISVLENVPNFIVNELMYYQKKGAAFLSFTGSDPELLKGIDTERIKINIQNRSKATEDFSKALMNDENPWTVAAFAQVDWAKKVFPDLDSREAVEKLWEQIFYTCRIDENAINNWKKHIDNLSNRAKLLNNLSLTKLHYKSSNGTDLEVQLPKNHIWNGGKSYSNNGHEFVANIPTEEVYTLPYKFGVYGKVNSTMPLNYSGNLISDFSLFFEAGKVVNFKASQGEDILKNLIETDKGSSYLGEVALVPFESPISQLGTLFYNTLFDENASCHLALGKAYPTSIENGEFLSQEELNDLGVNDSITHEDFMIGSKDLEIIGFKDNKEIQIFKDGNWAI